MLLKLCKLQCFSKFFGGVFAIGFPRFLSFKVNAIKISAYYNGFM